MEVTLSVVRTVEGVGGGNGGGAGTSSVGWSEVAGGTGDCGLV